MAKTIAILTINFDDRRYPDGSLRNNPIPLIISNERAIHIMRVMISNTGVSVLSIFPSVMNLKNNTSETVAAPNPIAADTAWITIIIDFDSEKKVIIDSMYIILSRER
jgi:hypothetical protein